ncbi:MAG: sugar ABC transporter permease [Pseudomonadota bacterium]|nr:sugar ABC transporter permease [Pseudomonadota bacterium]
MSNTPNSSQSPATDNEGTITRLVRATEIDVRIFGMIVALFIIWGGFDLYSRLFSTIGFDTDGLVFGGSFITPRNLWNLLNQTASIAIMSTGMLLLIVMRQLDLSIGSMLSTVAVAVGTLQVFHLTPSMGDGNHFIWIIAVLFALGLGTFMGWFNGVLTAYAKIPAFIVTLGGLIAYGGLAWAIIRGETVGPMDTTFELLGGNVPQYSLGVFWSWVVAAVGILGIAYALWNNRRQRQRFNFPLRPMWAEWMLGVVGSMMVAVLTWVVTIYPWAPNVVKQWVTDHHITVPAGIEDKDGNAICMAGDQMVRCVKGFIVYTGYSIPFLIAVAVGLIMSFVAARTSFGRHVYATGGNPEAAELSGINTRKLTVKVFMLMGFLVGIGAIITSARLNAATNSLGQSNELYVIAAVVIGGTSLAGGTGTVSGAMLGALLMQSLQSGMTLLNFESAYRDMVVGGVLVAAVFVDQLYRRRVK